jgi:hypothetical protein
MAEDTEKDPEKSGSNFDPTNRQEYFTILREAGYVEIEDFADANLEKGYWCNTCTYFRSVEPRSPTGSWCQKLAAPDRAFGCCNYWKISQYLRLPKNIRRND